MSSALLPLDVLLCLMRRRWAEGDHDAAAILARAAAPYLHSRQQSCAAPEGIRSLSDKELDAFCAADAGSRD